MVSVRGLLHSFSYHPLKGPSLTGFDRSCGKKEKKTRVSLTRWDLLNFGPETKALPSISTPLLIAESGSSKTDWAFLAEGEAPVHFRTQGVNPYFHNSGRILEILKEGLAQQHIPLSPSAVHFYGAGCSSPERKERVHHALRMIFPGGRILVEHDLLAAARALCQAEPGIATILGTGSNTCLYNGETIIRSRGGTGFILGDEGSGADMGKRLVKAVLNRDFPEGLTEEFYQEHDLTEERIVERVYREPGANVFLASFAPFIKPRLEAPELKNLVRESFTAFFKAHIVKYEDHRSLPLNSVGSVGYQFRDQLAEVASEFAVTLGKITDEPITGLVEYHQRHRPEGGNSGE